MDLAERLLYFRTLPAGGAASPEELMPLADNARDVFIREGTLVFARDREPDRFVCLVEGSVELVRDRLILGVLEAPAVVGIRAVMGRMPMPYDVRARGDLVALEVDSERFLQNVEDDFELWRRQVRFQNAQLCERFEADPRGQLPSRAVDLTGLPTERDLDLVERMLLIRRFGIFGRGSVNALAELAQQLVPSTREVGDVLFRRGDVAHGTYFVSRGAIEGRFPDGHAQLFTAGTVLGGVEALSDRPRFFDAVTRERASLLYLDIESLFDVVEDNTEIATAFLSGTARAVFELDVVKMIAAAEAKARP